MGCHCLFQCMKLKSESEVTQSCPTLRNPMDCSPPGSSVHGIFQPRVLEWGSIAFPALHINSQLLFAVCIKAPRSHRPRSGCSHHPDAVFTLSTLTPHCTVLPSLQSICCGLLLDSTSAVSTTNFFFFFLMVCCG